ncbi:MAG: glycine betaine ABC transporter substrate-binding protein [Bdellovibrionia bacterium]
MIKIVSFVKAFLLFTSLSLLGYSVSAGNPVPITVGSKAFTEGYLLGELVAQTIENSSSSKVARRFGMGGTGVLFEALRNGSIDLYPEYTGTIAEAILKDSSLQSISQIREALKSSDLIILDIFKFNNSYGLAVRRAYANKHHLKQISDLIPLAKEIRGGFSSEFMSRPDCYPGLVLNYGLDFAGNVRSMEHSLTYEALAKKEIDLTDIYTTDGKIRKLDLVVLKDDRHFFREYRAVLFAKQQFIDEHAEAMRALSDLGNRLDEATMTRLNAEVDVDKREFSSVVLDFISKKHITNLKAPSVLHRVLVRTHEHLWLVGVSLFFSILVGFPLGIIAYENRILEQAIILFSSIVQTIPSLALLCFLIPLFGIGDKPAMVAIFLYGLLPIVINTFVGFKTLDPKLIEVARALGLNRWERLVRIEIPLASQNILVGIKSSAIIGIGTSTLAALIGSGGYGVPIITGLAMNDMEIVLTGAIPATIMALLAHILFEMLSRVLVPRGLRITQ